MNLSSYLGQDLRKLGDEKMMSLRKAFEAGTGDELGGKRRGGLPWESWSLQDYNTPDSAWIIVEAYPGYEIPDISEVQLHFFDRSWTRTCKHTFPTGYRSFLKSVTVKKRREFDRPLIVAKVTSSGPFIVSPGPKKPAFAQGHFHLQHYALLGTNLFLVRLEDDQGVLVRNHYRWQKPFKGPEVPQRTKAAWIKSLDSASAVEQLAALVWLTGSHLSSKEKRKADHSQEPLKDSKTFEAVRDDPRTQPILDGLKKHPNKWIREYVALGIE